MLLKNILEQDFTLVGFEDLGNLTVSPTACLKFLENLYKQEYLPNERIVLYTNRPIPDQLLEHLYETTNFLDISNWFILICSSQDLGNQLKQTCEQYSTDPVPFQNLVTSVGECKDLENNFAFPKTMCAIPWSNIEVKAEGAITPCCMFTGSFGHIQKDTLLDVFNGEQMAALRQDFLDGKKHTGCRGCWDKEDRGLTSIRQHNINRLKTSFLKNHYDTPTISTVDLKFQNTCNFKCRICNSTNSSLYAEESSRFKKIPLVPQLKWSESDSFTQQITELLPTLTNIDMYGGEPFLIKKFGTVLKAAVENNYAKNIRLHYNTNGSVWPGTFVELWKHFKEVDIHFSIDAIGAQFELQRGGSWANVEENILKIKNLGYHNMTFSVMPSVSIMNVYYIDQVIEWATNHGFQIFVSHVTIPEEYSLINLTPQARDMILEKHRNSTWPEMQKIISLVESINGSDGSAFCDKTKYYDTIRNENFAIDHPEIAFAMGYSYNNSNDTY